MSRRLLLMIICAALLYLPIDPHIIAAEDPIAAATTNAAQPAAIELRIYALRKQYEAGAPVDILLSITSLEHQLRLVFDERPELDFKVIVTRVEGGDVPPTQYYSDYLAGLRSAAIRNYRERALGRNHDLSYVLRVNRLFDMSMRGRYEIKLQRNLARHPDPPLIVTSNEVTVDVVTPPLR